MDEKDFVKELANKYRPVIKDFPDEFSDDFNTTELALPGKTLVIGTEIFGQYELMDSEGDLFMQVENHDKTKFILYANRTLPLSVKIPNSDEEIVAAVKRYEKYLDNIVKDIISDYLFKYPTSNRYMTVTTNIFRMLNLTRY